MEIKLHLHFFKFTSQFFSHVLMYFSYTKGYIRVLRLLTGASALFCGRLYQWPLPPDLAQDASYVDFSFPKYLIRKKRVRPSGMLRPEGLAHSWGPGRLRVNPGSHGDKSRVRIFFFSPLFGEK